MSTLNSICTYHYQEKIHISFEACFLIPMSLFVMYVSISLNKIVFKPMIVGQLTVSVSPRFCVMVIFMIYLFVLDADGEVRRL